MFKFIFAIAFCTVIFNQTSIMASQLEILKQKYVDYILECTYEFPITATDIDQLKNKQMPDNHNVRCLFACAYKKAGMMTDQGELSVDGVNEISRHYFADDPDQIRRAEEFTDACRSVNDVAVSDGYQGCERAELIFKCSVEKAPQFDLV